MSLRLLSFNIWFSQHEMQRRMHAIGDLIASTSPDLVALQEMTQDHWRVCLAHPAFKEFSWSQPERQGYYTLIGSRSHFSSAPLRRPFEATLMGRDLLYATVEPPGLPLLVFATSHLESLDRAKVRREQMLEGFGRLGTAPDVVWCGDTNINEGKDGPTSLPSGWQDAWTALRPQEGGYSFDVERNEMVPLFDGWAVQNKARIRYDRFWVKSANYTLAAIEMLDEPIDKQLWPSDHFGLLLTLEAKNVPNQQSGQCESSAGDSKCMLS
mmetsp:Transcript_98236/g.256596  ORF Transcript_98236/g.256596 Transcript_98236/m.256596 type:complete len:268 (+) Transcript_98236:85-888(+)